MSESRPLRYTASSLHISTQGSLGIAFRMLCVVWALAAAVSSLIAGPARRRLTGAFSLGIPLPYLRASSNLSIHFSPLPGSQQCGTCGPPAHLQKRPFQAHSTGVTLKLVFFIFVCVCLCCMCVHVSVQRGSCIYWTQSYMRL